MIFGLASSTYTSSDLLMLDIYLLLFILFSIHIIEWQLHFPHKQYTQTHTVERRKSNVTINS